MAATSEGNNDSRRKKVLVGTLPPDFLRFTADREQQESADQQAAIALTQQFASASMPPNLIGRLSITVSQAKLVKNYGLTRMDPYVKLRVGHAVYETNTDPNGSKNPHWNKDVHCLLPQGVNSISIEIYDACSFTMDELIAWTEIPIPPSVFTGETIDAWYPLDGKLGNEREGTIKIVLSYYPGMNPYLYGSAMSGSVVMVPSTAPNMFGIPQFAPVSVYTQVPVNPCVMNAQVLSQIEEMFPNMDKSVVRTVFETHRGHKEATVNTLLQMSE